MGRCYPHLNLEERRKLAKWLDAKIPIKEIADNLGRAPSTIYREIKRNYYSDTELPQLNGYHAMIAHDKYEPRRALHRKLIRYPQIMSAVRDGFDSTAALASFIALVAMLGGGPRVFVSSHWWHLADDNGGIADLGAQPPHAGGFCFGTRHCSLLAGHSPKVPATGQGGW